MNFPNSKDYKSSRTEKKNSLSQKDIHFVEFNKKLDDIISNIQTNNSSLENIHNANIDLINNNNINKIKINNQTQINNVNKDFQENNNDENNLQKIRLNFENLITSDILADSYDIIPSYEMCMKMNDNNNNENFSFELPYCSPFKDKILLGDESIFFVYDDEYKQKFISKEDIENMKKDKIELNFGKDPNKVYGQICERKILNDRYSYDSLNNFIIYKIKEPYYVNNNMNNENDFEHYNANNYNNNYYINNENSQNCIDNPYDNLTTRPNSGRNDQNKLAPSTLINDKNFLLNNGNIYKDENEESIEKENENNIYRKYINKKRKS